MTNSILRVLDNEIVVHVEHGGMWYNAIPLKIFELHHFIGTLEVTVSF